MRLRLRSLYSVLRNVRRLFRPDNPGVTDSDLLARFQANRDEAAFELLVWRHGPMVLGVCRRHLRDEHAAEDAFQATFVALAQTAPTLGEVRSLGGWLYTVASRTARRARSRAGRRALVEQSLGDRPVLQLDGDPAADAERRDFRRALDREVSRLPEKYRAVFVLCCLEGKTNDEAAEQLGCPRGTVLSRLSRARERLRQRLSEQGMGMGMAVLPFGQLLAGSDGELPVVASELVNETVHLSLTATASTVVASAVAAKAAGPSLTGTVLTMLTLNAKLLAIVVALGLATAGAGVYAYNNMLSPTPITDPSPVDATEAPVPACGAKMKCCSSASE